MIRVNEALERLRRKIQAYARKLEKTDPDLASQIHKHVDDFVTWYDENRREMTEEEFMEFSRGKNDKKTSHVTNSKTYALANQSVKVQRFLRIPQGQTAKRSHGVSRMRNT